MTRFENQNKIRYKSCRYMVQAACAHPWMIRHKKHSHAYTQPNVTTPHMNSLISHALKNEQRKPPFTSTRRNLISSSFACSSMSPLRRRLPTQSSKNHLVDERNSPDKYKGVHCREKPWKSSGPNHIAPNCLADQKHCA